MYYIFPFVAGVECKSRWRSIRDYYKKQKKDAKNGVSQVPAVKRRQVYWNSLKFLDDVDDELKALSNVHVEISEDAEDIIDFQVSENDTETPIANLPIKRRRLHRKELLREKVDRLEEPREQGETAVENSSCKQLEETVDFSSDKLDCRLKERFKHEKERRIVQDPEVKSIASEQDGVDDEIDLFFKAMAATVKKFPPKLRIESKAKIFTVVNELETRHLESTNQLPSFMGVQGE